MNAEPPAPHHAGHYRGQADMFRQMAEIEPVAEVRELLLNIAEQYDKLADHLSRRHRLRSQQPGADKAASTIAPVAPIPYAERKAMEDRGMTYVVRVAQTQPEEGDEYRVFRALPDAAKLFKAVDAAAVPDQRNAAYLYEVPGEDNPSAAIDAVKAGKAVILNRDPFADWVKDAAKWI